MTFFQFGLGAVLGLLLGFFLFEGKSEGNGSSSVEDSKRPSGMGVSNSGRQSSSGSGRQRGGSGEDGNVSDLIFIDRSLASRIPAFFLNPELSINWDEIEMFGFTVEQAAKLEEIVFDLLYRSVKRETESSRVILQSENELIMEVPSDQSGAQNLKGEIVQKLERIVSSNGLNMSDLALESMSDLSSDFGARDRVIRYGEDELGKPVFEVFEFTKESMAALKDSRSFLSDYRRAAWKTQRFSGRKIPKSLEHLLTDE